MTGAPLTVAWQNGNDAVVSSRWSESVPYLPIARSHMFMAIAMRALHSYARSCRQGAGQPATDDIAEQAKPRAFPLSDEFSNKKC